MKKVIIILLCLTMLLFQSCQPNQNNQNEVFSGEKIIEKKVLPNEVDFYTTRYNSTEIVCNDKNKLNINTTYMNVPDSISFLDRLIFSQKLILYKNDIKIKSVNFPSKIKTIELQGKTVEIYETSIYKIKCHKRKDGTFIYNIHGSYEVDPPHEFFGLISSEGEWLYYYYGSMYEVYEEYGSEDKLVEEIGEEINDLRDMQRINF